MKKAFVYAAAVVFTLGTVVAVAQDNDKKSCNKPQGEKPDSTEMVKKYTAKMVEKYGLDEAQAEQLLALNLEYAEVLPKPCKGGPKGPQGPGGPQGGPGPEMQPGAPGQPCPPPADGDTLKPCPEGSTPPCCQPKEAPDGQQKPCCGEGQKPEPKDKEAVEAEMKAKKEKKDAYNDELKTILTEEQYAAYEADAKKIGGPQGGPKGPKGPGGPEPPVNHDDEVMTIPE